MNFGSINFEKSLKIVSLPAGWVIYNEDALLMYYHAYNEDALLMYHHTYTYTLGYTSQRRKFEKFINIKQKVLEEELRNSPSEAATRSVL